MSMSSALSPALSADGRADLGDTIDGGEKVKGSAACRSIALPFNTSFSGRRICSIGSSSVCPVWAFSKDSFCSIEERGKGEGLPVEGRWEFGCTGNEKDFCCWYVGSLAMVGERKDEDEGELEEGDAIGRKWLVCAAASTGKREDGGG